MQTTTFLYTIVVCAGCCPLCIVGSSRLQAGQIYTYPFATTCASHTCMETVTTRAPVIYLARSYTARHRLLASGTNILETFAFLLCFCLIRQQRRRLRRGAIVLLFAAPFCLPVCASFCSVVFSMLLRVRRGFLQMGDILVSFLFSFHAGSPEIGRRPHRPFTSVAVFPLTTYTCRSFCGHFSSVLLSAMFCLRLCFLRLEALLFCTPFSFRDGTPDIGNGACRFFFRCPSRDFRLRCSYPLYCFADASPGNVAIPAVVTDLVTIARTCKNDVAPATV